MMGLLREYVYQIGDVDMKNSETLIITDNVSTQDTVAKRLREYLEQSYVGTFDESALIGG